MTHENKILFQQQVCWQDPEELAGYPGTYLDLIVFDRGNGLEVIRTTYIDGVWQKKLAHGEIRVAKLPEHLLDNVELVVYSRKELQPLIG
jgi:hypothetical protein